MKYSVVSEVPFTSTNDAPKKEPSPADAATKLAKRPHRSGENPGNHDTNDILDRIIEEAKKVADLVCAAPLEISFSIKRSATM